MKAVDYLVETSNPDALDGLLTGTQSGELLKTSLDYVRRDGCFIMRLYRDAEAIAQAVESRFYGAVKGKLEAH